jgi:hypothetical protein
MTVQSIRQSNGQAATQSMDAILFRIDAIQRELRDLRQVIERYATDTPEIDIVEELAGSLGPGSVTELEDLNTFDVTWQRFAE